MPPPPPPRRIIPTTSPLNFLTYLPTLPPPTTLIICATPTDFFSSVPRTPSSRALTHLETLAAAENISVLFCPTLHHLRATLAAGEWKGGSLALWGAVEAHRDGGEFSAVGLRRTFAAAVEKAGVVVLGGRGRWWCEEVDVLSAGRDGLEGLEGRTVRVERVLGRWFVFEGEEEGGDEAGEGAEAGEEAGVETVEDLFGGGGFTARDGDGGNFGEEETGETSAIDARRSSR